MAFGMEIDMTKQNNALRLADWLDDQYDPDHYKADAAAELRRLHAGNAALQQGYDAARLEIESLRTGYEAARLEIESLRASHVQAPAQAAPAGCRV